TEARLRDQIRQPKPGMKITVPGGTKFSPSALDFIQLWNMEIVYQEHLSLPGPTAGDVTEKASPAWDKPGTFPVILSGEMPKCITCGTPLERKPEHMTQISATHFAPKNSPRIRFRGKIDSTHALCLLIAAYAKTNKLPKLAALLSTLAAYCREITSAEYNARPVAPLVLEGLDEEAIRKATHQPETQIGISHVIPSPDDPDMLHWLNYLRCQVREAEIVAMDTFAPQGSPVGDGGLVRALNRLSSAVYYLTLIYKAGKLY
ncbi:MAG: hypothetical protein U1B80_00455, partial [Anaerolineaceae bacterium]|nr:hypothetical protein [Anaerolineaceae bacterium]